MDRRKIIMNFSVPPSPDDMHVIAVEALENFPEELLDFCDDLTVEIEDFPDPATESELDLDDPYDLLAVFRSGKEIAPGVEKTAASGDDCLVLYRRPILDLWCETGDDLNMTVRQVMIEELGRSFDFSSADIEDMIRRHYQGML
jgi:predicted Zn-dependent protease with MMP-like domain